MSVDFISRLPPDEQDHIWRIRKLLMNIIEDFRKQGLLETRRTNNELKAINLIIQNANNYTEIMSGLGKRLGIHHITKEQFNELPVTGDLLAWIIILIAYYIMQVENFKNYFLYLLNKKKTFEKIRIGLIKTIGGLMKLIHKVSPSNWETLDNLISAEFRNALAHSQFWIREHEIHYVYNDNYDQSKVINIFDFLMHAKHQNIVSSTLGDLIDKHYKPIVR
ncbi:MAG: hypothetical protein HMLIMOIP_001816 [Candidatus Nitrosomirales archaeon]|jgi:hypothetical protein